MPDEGGQLVFRVQLDVEAHHALGPEPSWDEVAARVAESASRRIYLFRDGEKIALDVRAEVDTAGDA
jgi:hypothetical protein